MKEIEYRLTEVRFKTKDGIFEPDRIGGTEEHLSKLGIKVLGEKSKDSIMWDYEGVDVELPDKTFSVRLLLDKQDSGDWCGDVYFEEVGCVFGYVEDCDFEIVSGHNPFEEDDD